MSFLHKRERTSRAGPLITLVGNLYSFSKALELLAVDSPHSADPEGAGQLSDLEQPIQGDRMNVEILCSLRERKHRFVERRHVKPPPKTAVRALRAALGLEGRASKWAGSLTCLSGDVR